MSAATDMFIETVQVRLLDEGVDVWRPVKARHLGGGVYELSEKPAPKGEHWEFAPGQIVNAEARDLSDGPAIVAVAQAQTKRMDRR